MQNHTITCFAWHPRNHDLLAVCTNDDVIHVYDVATGAERQRLKFSAYGARHVEWHPRLETELTCVVKAELYKCDLGKMTLSRQVFSPKHVITVFARHPSNESLCAMGCENGSVWLWNSDTGQSQQLSRVFENTKIADVSFDPKSEDYLLAATFGGIITLWNVEGRFSVSSASRPTQLMEFAKQSPGLSACRWIASMPGTFVTSSERHGVIRTWNVSNQNPLESIKCDQGAVSSFAELRGGGGRAGAEAKIVASFKSGQVAIVDVRSRRQTWTSEEGHTETIFDCSLSPANPDDLFSCSFDGTIRRWDARMKKCVQTFYTADARARGLGGGDRAYEAGKGSLYSCAVSCDGSIVCGGGYEGKLYVFDVESGRAMPSLEENKLAIHRVVAHPSEPGVFAFACLDHTLTLVHVERHREGTPSAAPFVKCRIMHEAQVFGCAFDLFNPDAIAAGTLTGTIYVHRASLSDCRTPHAVLDERDGGHAKKCYGVTYSPLVPGRLLSVSDDTTARVWSLDGATGAPTEPAIVLRGHAKYVRGHAWHPEMPNVCFTGSWDATVRTWDVVVGACLTVSDCHLADVYAIATHPDRPFFAVTCSRDTTMRFWSTEALAPAAKLRAVMGADPSLAKGAGVKRRSDGPKTLAGRRVGGELSDALKRRAEDDGSPGGGGGELRDCARLRRVFEALSGHPAAGEMWRLASIEAEGPERYRRRLSSNDRGTNDRGTSAGYVPHRFEATAAAEREAEALEASVASARAGSAQKEAALRKAAECRLRRGDVRGYCERMREVGDWNAALAAAPAVSLAYWSSLAGARAEATAAEEDADPNDATAMRLVSGRAEEAAAALLGAGRGDDAFVVACAHDAGAFLEKMEEPDDASLGASRPPAAVSSASDDEDNDDDGGAGRLGTPSGSSGSVSSGGDDAYGSSAYGSSTPAGGSSSLRSPPFRSPLSALPTPPGGTFDAPSLDGEASPSGSFRSAASTPARGHSRANTLEALPDLAAALPPGLMNPGLNGEKKKLAPLAPLPPLAAKVPLRPLNVGEPPAAKAEKRAGHSEEGLRPEARDARAEGRTYVPIVEGARARMSASAEAPGGSSSSPPASKGGVSSSSGAAAVRVRSSQATTKLAHGDAVGAAALCLSAGDARGAATCLVRGAQPEMAAALMLALETKLSERPSGDEGEALTTTSAPGGDCARALLAERAAELGEWDLALAAASAISRDDARRWRVDLVLGARIASEGADSPSVVSFRDACAEVTRACEGGGLGEADAAASALARALAGDAESGARVAVDAAHAAVGSEAWDGASLLRIQDALAVIGGGRFASACDPKLRAEVTMLRCYLSALALASAGYTPAQHSLYHHARAALKRTRKLDENGTRDTGFPHPVPYVSLHELGHMRETYPADAMSGLSEVANAESVPYALREIAAEMAEALEATCGNDPRDKAPPPLAAAAAPTAYNGVVDWASGQDKMPMEEALRAASYWRAAGFADESAFKPPGGGIR